LSLGGIALAAPGRRFSSAIFFDASALVQFLLYCRQSFQRRIVKKSITSRSRNWSVRKAVFCSHAMKRPNYFTGQLLTADDFTAEQEYHRGKQRRHNLLFHGFGVVQGLEVSTGNENGGSTVVVEPGFAIDALGNEIELCTTVEFRLPKSQTAIQVGIRFSERFCKPVPTVSDARPLSSQPSRVEEGCEVVLSPLSRQQGSRAKERALGASMNILPLAHLVRTGRAWRVDRKFKAPHAR